MPTCATCVFWSEIQACGTGGCHKIEYSTRASNENHSAWDGTRKALIQARSDPYDTPRLYTRYDFGCVLHTAKPTKPANDAAQ